ncbi:MAG: phosphomannomutase/phosphoglucomutase [Gammaproteobacteria bacterium]|nr:phosphomannomutase/phosphoglucomutase [Gammaproteobacteria bacterium]
MKFPHHLFRAYDIRGVVETDLTAALVERIGRALGSEAQRRGGGEFVIGRDGRASGPQLADALARGVLASGCDVADIGLVPTPVLYFAANECGGTGAVVTASHNPPQYNGLKMMIAGVTLFGDAIQSLKQRVIDGRFSSGAGVLHSREMLTAYRRKIAADVRVRRPLKVVVDCGNGAAGVVAPQVFRDIGCEVVELFCEVDGGFPNHHPDPGRPENLQDLIAAVARHRADFGMAFDGDGDRLGVVSADGSVIWPDRLMLLFTERVLAERPGAEIIFDVKCSQVLARAITAGGGIATMCRTGHSFIKDKLRQTNAALAGEMSGHIFFNDRWGGFDDAVYAGARLCELLAAERRSPGDIFAALPDTVNTPELRIDMAEGAHYQLVDELAANARFEDAVVSDIDGIRVDFEYGFGLVRASNTSPALILRFEAGNRRQLEMIQSRFRQLLESTRPGLDLPF